MATKKENWNSKKRRAVYMCILLTYNLLTKVLAENKGRTMRDRPKGLSKMEDGPQVRATRSFKNGILRKNVTKRYI